MTIECIRQYTNDIRQQTKKNNEFLSLLYSVEKIRNYIVSLPYLSKHFIIPSEFQTFFKTIFYDQKKIKMIEQVTGQEP